jgi:hypothetical protein
MVERIEGLPEWVLAFSAKGTVTRSDYDQIIVPAVEEASAKHHKLRFLYDIGADFSEFETAVMWEDAKIGLKHLWSWDRVAVVTDIEWIRGAMELLCFLFHGHVRVFRNGQMAEAREWISEEI